MECRKKEGSKVEYQVSLSMLEIYCERVRDLLVNSPPPKGGLKVKEHPKNGFYVHNLRTVPVDSYKSIEARVNQGNRNRSIAATQMNETSSRAHTIVQIHFIQNDTGAKTRKSSVINLVDLAGSERHMETGSTGDRLKEGIVINQSLLTLGRCIKALHESQKNEKLSNAVQVPYRDSVLTCLLKHALGGNSRTIMIAATSPADIHYQETLSTLKFADRAKNIKTRAVVNESATEKLIRELRAENRRLLGLLKNIGVDVLSGSSAASEEVEDLRYQLEVNRAAMESMDQSWQKRIQQERERAQAELEESERRTELLKSTPHFWNLDKDPALSHTKVQVVQIGDSMICLGQDTEQFQFKDSQLHGQCTRQDHAILTNIDNLHISITPPSGTPILINGKAQTKKTQLHHNDRLMFGEEHFYVFAHPKWATHETSDITYDLARKEIAAYTAMGRGSDKFETESAKGSGGRAWFFNTSFLKRRPSSELTRAKAAIEWAQIYLLDAELKYLAGTWKKSYNTVLMNNWKKLTEQEKLVIYAELSPVTEFLTSRGWETGRRSLEANSMLPMLEEITRNWPSIKRNRAFYE